MDFKINLDFLPIKALYFLFMAGFACMIPYLPVYFVYLGLDIWQVGIMRGMEPCLVFLLSPVWGAIADKFSKHKPALILALMGSSVFYCTLVFVPLISDCFTDTALTNITQGNYLISDCTVERTLTLPSSSELDPTQEQDVCSDLCQEVLDSYPVFESEENYLRCAAKSDNWECDLCGLEAYGNVSGKDQEEDGGDHGKQPARGRQILVNVAVCETEFPYSPDTANGSFDRVCGVDSFDMEVCECHITTNMQTPSSMRVTFALCFLLVAISVAFNCNILAFLDAILMQKLGAENRKDYGKHRMWGAVGFGAMAFLSGIAIDTYTSITDSSSTRFEPLFILFLVSMVCAVVLAATLRYPQHEKPEMMHHDLWSLAKQPEVLMFLFVITVEGISFGMCFSYVLIFLTNDLEASHTLLGLSILVTTMAEIPVLFTSGKIIKWIGYEGVVYATLAAYALRYLGYGLISNPWLVLPIQALHGITFGLGWPGFTNFAITNAPKGMATTLQAIMLGMYIGVGTAIGNLFGGFIYEAIGARKLFFANVGLLVFTGLVFFVGNRFFIKKPSKASATPTDTKGVEDVQMMEVTQHLNGNAKPQNGKTVPPEGETMLAQVEVEIEKD